MEAKGGKASLGTSPIVEAEKEALWVFARECEAIGPITTEAKAKEYRTAIVKIHPEMAKVFSEHKLDY